jgi:hypothetical protein
MLPKIPRQKRKTTRGTFEAPNPTFPEENRPRNTRLQRKCDDTPFSMLPKIPRQKRKAIPELKVVTFSHENAFQRRGDTP